MSNGIVVIWAREQLRAGPSVFLAGPTPRTEHVASWRPNAIAAIEDSWQGPGPLNVLTPEPRTGRRDLEYNAQLDWEITAMDAADAILFWIPRDLSVLPGFTANVEFGRYVGSGRAVLGCPPDCPNPERNRYLIFLAHRLGAPVRETMVGAVEETLHLLGSRV